MSEAEYIAEFIKRWPRDLASNEPSEETILLVNRAVIEHPRSSKLWVMRGDLIQLIDFESSIPLKEAEKSYRKAIKTNPFNIEAYESMGYFLDAVMAKPRKAKRYFAKARLLKRPNTSVKRDCGTGGVSSISRIRAAAPYLQR